MQLRPWKKLLASWLAGSLLASGCATTPKEVSYLGERDFNYYKNKAQAVEFSNVDQPTPDDVLNSDRPRTIKDRTQDEIWDLTLVEAIHTAVTNNRMIRTRGQFLTPSALLTNPQNAASIYDPAIRETGFLFGGRGVEAALADFDTTFTTSINGGRNSQVVNNGFGFLAPGFVNNTESGAFNSGLQKVFANGGLMSLSHNWNYSGSNSPGLLFPSNYTGVTGVQYQLPLWAGAGTEYTRTAGPIVRSFGGISGVTQGVSIARINTDISIADFELAVTQMVRDVELLYWDLYLNYRQYDAEIVNRDSALRTWREVRAKMDVGASGGSASAEAQARENYFETRARVEQALGNLYNNENQLRRLLALPVNDGRVIRPSDTPTDGEFEPSWEISLTEALTHRVELRRQKWNIKSLELQYVAAKSQTNPRLDFVSNYQINAFGRDLLSYNNADGITATGFQSAYGSLSRAGQTGWNLGLQFSMPIGFRAAYSQMRNTELQLMKARAALAAAEEDISHELANSIQNLDQSYVTARTNFNRLLAADRRVQATQAEYELGVRDATLDLVLRAQASKAAGEIAVFTALVRYNQALAEYHYYKGMTLPNNGIQLAESDFSAEAQQEALRRAWARSYAKPNNLLHTEPDEHASPDPYPKTDLGFPNVRPKSSLPPPPATNPAEEPPLQQPGMEPEAGPSARTPLRGGRARLTSLPTVPPAEDNGE